jgi:hypothetical protein
LKRRTPARRMHDQGTKPNNPLHQISHAIESCRASVPQPRLSVRHSQPVPASIHRRQTPTRPQRGILRRQCLRSLHGSLAGPAPRQSLPLLPYRVNRPPGGAFTLLQSGSCVFAGRLRSGRVPSPEVGLRRLPRLTPSFARSPPFSLDRPSDTTFVELRPLCSREPAAEPERSAAGGRLSWWPFHRQPKETVHVAGGGEAHTEAAAASAVQAGTRALV